MGKSCQLDSLAKKIYGCTGCSLSATRKRAVPGEGSPDAKIFFVAEAPGGSEDACGRPFTGRSGKIVDLLLAKLQLKREEVFISNIVKCRPPQNRDPSKEEIIACRQYLFDQLRIIKPLLIITLGKFAGSELFGALRLSFESIGSVHGKLYHARASYGTVKIMALFHPAAVCYDKSGKAHRL